MRPILVILLLLPITVLAQLEPGPEHYEAAANQIALNRAAAHLLEAEAEAKLDATVAGIIRRIAAEEHALRQQRLDAHAARVRAWAGQVGQSRVAAVPGTGWHEVSR